MRIWATALSIADDDHAPGCARWVPLDTDDTGPGQLLVTPDRWYHYDNTKPCTCRTGPLQQTGEPG